MKITFKTLFIAIAFALALTGCKKPEPTPVALSAPTPEVASVGIDNATLIWEAVKDAVSYEILINDETTVEASGVSATLTGLQAGTAYTVVMKSIAPDDNPLLLDSEYGTPVEFATNGKGTLDSPVLSTKDLGPDTFTLYWTAVKNAEKYVYVFNNGQETETTETYVTFTDLTYGTEYAVKVKAVPTEKASSTTLESAWAEKTVKTNDRSALGTPALSSSEITPNGFKISWTAVANAASYKYKVNDGAEQTTTSVNFTTTGLSAATEYNVSVCAIPAASDAGRYVDSQWATLKVKTSDLIVLGTPVLKSENVLATTFTVTWAAIDNAGKYVITLNGAAYATQTENSVSFSSLMTETEYTVTVKAVPADAGLVTYKESPAATIKVTTKSGPSENDKDGNISDFEEGSIF